MKSLVNYAKKLKAKKEGNDFVATGQKGAYWIGYDKSYKEFFLQRGYGVRSTFNKIEDLKTVVSYLQLDK